MSEPKGRASGPAALRSAGIEASFHLAYPGFVLDAELALPNKGIIALFGHSGSGKTTVLRAIAGLERVPGGRLVVGGETWQDGRTFVPTHHRPLGYVFQEASLFPHLSVRANLTYGMRRSANGGAPAFDHIVELLGISGLLERRPERLSGGERQRVAIARALLTRPRLLLMDEPLAALDQARKEEILPYLEQLHEELQVPVLYVSHSPDEVARLADYLVVLEGGRVLGAGPLTETLARLDLPIRLGEDAGVVLDAVVAGHDSAWHLARVEFPGGSLWVRDKGIPTGRHVRVRILARDVSIARERMTGTSILNTLPATVAALGDDAHPALRLVKLTLGPGTDHFGGAAAVESLRGAPLLARVTSRSAAALALEPGLSIWVQIKAVALIK